MQVALVRLQVGGGLIDDLGALQVDLEPCRARRDTRWPFSGLTIVRTPVLVGRSTRGGRRRRRGRGLARLRSRRMPSSRASATASATTGRGRAACFGLTLRPPGRGSPAARYRLRSSATTWKRHPPASDLGRRREVSRGEPRALQQLPRSIGPVRDDDDPGQRKLIASAVERRHVQLVRAGGAGVEVDLKLVAGRQRERLDLGKSGLAARRSRWPGGRA